MARGDSYNALDDVFGDDLGSALKVEKDDLEVEVTEKETVTDKKDKTTKPKKNVVAVPEKEKEVETAPSFDIEFDSPEQKSVPKLFQIIPEINDIMHNIVHDENNKRKSGSKGFYSILANNAIIKELIAMGVIDESYLKYIEPYN